MRQKLYGVLEIKLELSPSPFRTPSLKVKNKNMNLQQLIDSLKFNWVNPSIIADNFPPQPIRGTDFKVFKFEEYISSEDAIKRIEAEGYKPANIYELLTWAKDSWTGSDLVVGLGQRSSDGGVACLGDWSDRDFSLGGVDDDWDGDCQFLGVRESKLENSKPQKSSEPLESLVFKTDGQRIAEGIERVASALERLADKFVPKKGKK